MIRKIIHIDEDKCIGCGLCAGACHEGAIGMINGKARLLRDDYCDGLGDCLPVCPTEAITFEEREASAYNEAAVLKNKTAAPSSAAALTAVPISSDAPASCCAGNASRLRHWPVQIKLTPVKAPCFDGADLLIAADCTAYAYGRFHEDFIKDRITLIGCPKLDSVDYSEKLAAIIRENNVKSVTVIRMEVPCCGGMEHAAVTALKSSGKFLPWQVITVSTEGTLL